MARVAQKTYDTTWKTTKTMFSFSYADLTTQTSSTDNSITFIYNHRIQMELFMR